MLTLADGQVAATTAAEILSGGSAGAQRVTCSFVNTNAAAQTLIITFTRNGGTSRVIRRAVLAQHESLEIRGLPIDAGDSLLAVTTTASAVDYVIGGEGASSSGPMVSAVYDASGMLKTSNAASTALSTAQTITSASATAIAAGPNGTTNPSFVVDASGSSAATGVKVTSAAAASGAALAVISSGTNENLTIDAKGSGTITLNATGTGNIVLSRSATIAGTLAITSASATAFTVGRLGSTTPGFTVDASTSTCVTGVKITPAAAAAGVAVVVTSSGTNEAMTLDAKGSGTITIGATSTGAVTIGATSQALIVPGPLTRGIGASTAAAGSTTSDAGALPAGTAGVYPTTAADDTKGVVIHANDKVTGRVLFIGNGVSNKILKVYPASGGTINGAAADAAFSSASGKGVIAVCLSSGSNTWLAW